MEVKRQPAHTFNKNAYFGHFQTVEVCGLREIILGGEAVDSSKDLRPFHVVERYLKELGFQAGRTDDGEIVLVRQLRDGKKQARRISIARMLYLCRDKSREKQSASESNYKRMCAEEDEEELELVLALYHKTAKSSIGVRPDEQNNEPKPAVVNLSDPDDWTAQEVKRVLVSAATRPSNEAIPPYMLC